MSRQRGAQAANTNAMKHGGRTQRHGLVLLGIGKLYPDVAHDIRRWARRREAKARADHGGVLTDEAREVICLAARWEATARVHHRLAGEAGDGEKALHHLTEAAKATERRQAALAELGKMEKPDPWTVLLSQEPASRPEAAEGSGAGQGDENASTGPVGDVEPETSPSCGNLSTQRGIHDGMGAETTRNTSGDSAGNGSLEPIDGATGDAARHAEARHAEHDHYTTATPGPPDPATDVTGRPAGNSAMEDLP